jgi:hypothetical protein
MISKGAPPAVPQAPAGREAAGDAGESEGSRAAALVADDPDLEYFVTDVACGGDPTTMERASAVFSAAMPHTGVVMLSAGARRLVVHARVPAARASAAGCAHRLVAEALVDVPHVLNEGATDLSATAVVWKDESTGREPFADKDTARTAVAQYMHEAGLFGDSEDDEYERQYGAAYADVSGRAGRNAEGGADRVGADECNRRAG